MGKINTIWPEPRYYPTNRWNRKVMGLKDALGLKSFDTSEFEIRATKTVEGKPYLQQVNDNLYLIRDPVVAEGQGGSGLVPLEQPVNVSPLRSISAIIGDKGKAANSSDVQGS
ncbi:hypothetical protein Hanom_Chr06g00498631 [Helianthus anomalus]